MVNKDIDYRIKAGWMIWKMTLGALCDRKVPTRLKEKQTLQDNYWQTMLYDTMLGNY